MTPLNESQWSFLFSVGERIVPPLAGLDGDGHARCRAIIAAALAERPPGVRRQIRLFLSLVRLAPLLRWVTTFERLPAHRQEKFLRWLQDDAPGRLRQGFWGLKTIVFMGYYGQGELGPRLAYTPSRSGNEKLHA